MSRLCARRTDVGLKKPIESAGTERKDRSDHSDDLERKDKEKRSDTDKGSGKLLEIELDQQEIDDSSLLDASDR